MADISLTMDSYANYEPMKSNWYAISIQGLGDSYGDALSISCHSCTLPKLTTDVNEHHRFNERAYTPGKSKWDSISLEFYEFLTQTEGGSGASGTNTNTSAGEILKKWQESVHNPITGKNGSKKQVAKNMVIVQVDGEGNTVRTWNIYNAWPTSLEFDSVNSKEGSELKVSCTLQYDYAVLESAK